MAAEEGLEAGVGAEGIPPGPNAEIAQHSVTFLAGREQPRNGLFVLVQPKTDVGQHVAREVLLGPSPLEIFEDPKGLLSMPDEAQGPAENCLRKRVSGGNGRGPPGRLDGFVVPPQSGQRQAEKPVGVVEARIQFDYRVCLRNRRLDLLGIEQLECEEITSHRRKGVTRNGVSGFSHRGVNPALTGQKICVEDSGERVTGV